MKKLLLLSGGLDSTTLLHELHGDGNDVFCLMFNYHQRHKQELLFAREHCSMLKVQSRVLDIPDLGGLNEQSWIVPNRNMVFLSIAANVAHDINSDSILIGCNSDDASMFPDCREDFLKSIEQAISYAGYSVKVIAPFLKLTKREIAEKAKQFGINSNNIWTCYRGGSKQCGTCPACIKLKESNLCLGQ